MFGSRKNGNTPGEDRLNTSTGAEGQNRPSASLEKMEGKKEKLSRLFRRKDTEEEPVSLYEPEMEFVTEEELAREQQEKEREQAGAGQSEPAGDDGQTEASDKEKKRAILSERKRNGEDGQDAGTDGGAAKGRGLGRFFHKKGKEPDDVTSAASDSMFEDEPILYDTEEEKGFRKLSKKKIIVIAGAAVIVIGAASYFLATHLGGTVDGTAYVESVKDIMGYGSGSGMNNRYTGEVEAQDSWNITLESDLSVDECYVKEGDQVKEGDKLFSYNTEELRLAKERAELEVETLKNENTQLERDIKTYQSDLNSASTRERIELQTEILTAQTTIKKNEYSIDSAEEEVKDLEKNIKDAVVTSKMDGVVQSINEEVGASSGVDSSDDDDYSDDYYSDYSDGGDDSTYMIIVAVGDYRVKGSVSETNVWALTEGDPIIIRSRVDENATWTGVIDSINTDETEESDESSGDMDYYMDESSGESASTYNFYVELDSDDGLMMGQHVLIEQDFGQDEEKEGIWLPSAYLYMDEDKYYVWMANSRDRLELHEVTVGEYDEDLDQYEILEGLSMDDCIASDTGSLQENMRTTTDISEVDTTEYYEEETSDDEVYGDDGEYYDEDYSDMDYYDEYYDESYDETYDESYDDVDFSEDAELIDEGL